MQYKLRLITGLFAYGLIVGAILGLVMYYIKPMFDLNVIIGVSLCFWVMESVIVSLVDTVANKGLQKQLINVYMLAKVVKILVTLALILIYKVVWGNEFVPFILVCLITYLLFLIPESYIFIKIEKRYNLKK